MTSSAADPFDRALGALVGAALGDALGMPTQTLSAEDIAARHGVVTGFVAADPDHPVSRGLRAGSVTDDTEQTLLLARVLLDGGERFDHAAWVRALLAWETDVRARGSLDLLGPSTRRALEAIQRGVPAEEAGRAGDTNGAAMRIAPVGIAVPPRPIERLVDAVEETCRATHGTGLAISSAAAVAAAVSTGVDGGDWALAVERAVEAARIGSLRGAWVAGASLADRITWARQLVTGRSPQDGARLVRDLVGTSVASQESVPAAFAVVDLAEGDAWHAAVIAANIGGDTDTIGAIAAGMAAACSGFHTLPADRIDGLVGFDLAAVRDIVTALLERRRSRR